MTILPDLERHLFEAAKQCLPAADDQERRPGRHDWSASAAAARQPRPRSRLRTATAVLPAVIAVAVTVAVAAIALTALRHARGSGPVGSSSRQQLIRTLGVLRGPQTKADAAAWLPGFLGRGHQLRRLGLDNLTVDKPLIRTVRLPRSGFEVELLPVTWQPAPDSARRLEGLVVTLSAPGIYFQNSGPRPASVALLRQEGLPVLGYGGNGVNRGVVVVPDGVARVELGPFRLLDVPARIAHPNVASATAGVHDNVAAFQLSDVTIERLHLNPAAVGPFFYSAATNPCHNQNSAVYAIPAAAQMTWFDTRGRALLHSEIRTDLYVGTRHPVPATEPLLPGTTTCASRGR